MQCFIGPCRLLIHGRKSKCPKTDSCGTSHAMLEVLDTKTLIQIAYGLLNMIHTICLSIHIFHSSQLAQQNAMIPSIKAFSRPTKYHMQSYHYQELSLLPQPHLTEHAKLNNAPESQTEGNM